MRLAIAKPPSRHGSASSSRSRSEIFDLPVSAGRNLFLMMSSIGERRLSMSRVVLIA